MNATREELIALLLEARHLNNSTVRYTDRVEKWRRSLDKALIDEIGDNPEDRYDAFARKEQREYNDYLFRAYDERGFLKDECRMSNNYSLKGNI